MFSEGSEFFPDNNPNPLSRLLPPSLLLSQVLSPFMLAVQGNYLDQLYTPRLTSIEDTARYISHLVPRLPRGVMASAPLELNRADDIIRVLQFKSDKVGDCETAYLPSIHDFLLPRQNQYSSNQLPFEESHSESAIILRGRSGRPASMSLLIPEDQCYPLKKRVAQVIEQTGIWQAANAVLPTYLETPPSALLGLMLWQSHILNSSQSNKIFSPIAIKKAQIRGESFTLEAVVHDLDEPVIRSKSKSLQNVVISGEIGISDAGFSYDGKKYVCIEALRSDCFFKDPFQLAIPDGALSDVVRSRFTQVYLNFLLFPLNVSFQRDSDEVAKLINPLLAETNERIQKEKGLEAPDWFDL
jgi:hypothetical protein